MTEAEHDGLQSSQVPKSGPGGRSGAGNRDGQALILEKLPAANDSVTHYFDPRIFSGPMEISNGLKSAQLREWYRAGIALVRDPLPDASKGWRELQFEITCEKPEKNSSNPTGVLTVALTHEAPSARSEGAIPILAQEFPQACGFTLSLLPKSLMLWSSIDPEPPAGLLDLAVAKGDTLRLLVSATGSCELVKQPAGRRMWQHIAGWQTHLSTSPVYAIFGMRHALVVNLPGPKEE
eukprot:gnl/MRDRNA2_/MRDRNA2_101866_c0_seq1.p1 gnl/MRDRNA2_/MRDRNA2_101866_c0~~gnl/MRDRNA2_/MRDRNA2_101866_c0_seq1.p1  ORF type:complete len:236 (-),score=37.61 gnl/MRDRNA2_/MRDRNA2_101866_c0_seq1:96-803(-)